MLKEKQNHESFNLTENIYTVSDFTNSLKNLIEEKFSFISIKGEISNLSQPTSGHIYFTLKDEKAEIKAVMFRGYKNNLKLNLHDGMEIIAVGDVSIYTQRGYHQLIVKNIEVAGQGSLFIAFEKLKKKLNDQGLFNKFHKKKLPKFPLEIGIITSSTGAAVEDIINILTRRAPHVKLNLRPTIVQGTKASNDIIQAIDQFDKNKNIELIILCRGGGSIEDLWCFNEEKLINKIFECQTPIITGIGHETDFTLADFASDLRAPTPSAAAELASISLDEIEKKLINFKVRFSELLNIIMNNSWQRLDNISIRYGFQKPSLLIESKKKHLNEKSYQLKKNFQNSFNLKSYHVESIKSKLQIIDPKLILKRGYSIVYENSKNKIIKSIHEISNNEDVYVKMSDGSIKTQIKKIIKNEKR